MGMLAIERKGERVSRKEVVELLLVHLLPNPISLLCPGALLEVLAAPRCQWVCTLKRAKPILALVPSGSDGMDEQQKP